ncbi:hypothetical protein SLEP1_g35219 [Rubroshorea leprosula]|uniref:protein-serine/threonine phosphatase n=1 Tax=Rubroshorea leprosula TaxID=152421 RepID=A0AAV5KMI9_9ROSI|nr:hypothetical protein SLEP1_g35219 [Rubroshorea leprosula]
MMSDVEDELDLGPLFWSRDIDEHPFGTVSLAMLQANPVMEDHCQFEIGRDSIFVGVYDGHGDSDEASRFLADNLCNNLTRLAQKGTMSEDVLKRAVVATEDEFLQTVYDEAGSCCLATVIWKGSLYVANVGNSRVVIGILLRKSDIFAEQVTKDHIADVEDIRKRIKALHRDDPDIVFEKDGVWCSKGIPQVSRAIGSAFLKIPNRYVHSSFFQRYKLYLPFNPPLLKGEPELCRRLLYPDDKFLILASGGLWENLTKKKVVEIVNENKQTGIARRVIIRALKEVAKKKQMRFDDLLSVKKEERRSFHDDISVLVIFLNHDFLEKGGVAAHERSIRGFSSSDGPSSFRICEEIVDFNTSSNSGLKSEASSSCHT